MKKSYTIASVGVCLGKKPGFEALAESVIAGTPVAGKEQEDSLDLAVREAMQYTDLQKLPIVTDTQAPGLGEQKVYSGFRQMLENAPENVLLLSRRENGWMAMALTQEDRGFARVEITDDGSAADGDGFLDLLLTALEIRFALHLDNRDSNYRFWDSKEQRSKELCINGLRLNLTEPKIPASKRYAAKKFLLPLVFTTVAEAKQKLTALKSVPSLQAAMDSLLPELANRNEKTNTIVLLADSLKTLAADVDDLLAQADKLLDVGFVWKRPSGSRYICRSCEKPQIVFMNPPASMFNARTFYKFFFTLYGTMQQIHHFETNKMLTGDKDIFFSDYMFDIVVNYLVTSLLEGIGIKPDVLSGASMGEMANILQYLQYGDGRPSEIGAPLANISEPLEFMMRSDDEPLNAYLGRKTDGFTKFYVKGDAKAICKAAEKYDGAFVMIVGSTEDVILTGERSALRQLIEEVGCVANELYVANYIHTPRGGPSGGSGPQGSDGHRPAAGASGLHHLQHPVPEAHG